MSYNFHTDAALALVALASVGVDTTGASIDGPAAAVSIPLATFADNPAMVRALTQSGINAAVESNVFGAGARIRLAPPGEFV